MHTHDAALRYRQASIETAPPIKIVRLLYEGALRFLDRARSTDPSSAGPEFVAALARADAIVSELRASLDPKPAVDVANDLDRLYEFVQGRIAKAITERATGPVDEARIVLAKLCEGWQAIEIQSAPSACG